MVLLPAALGGHSQRRQAKAAPHPLSQPGQEDRHSPKGLSSPLKVGCDFFQSLSFGFGDTEQSEEDTADAEGRGEPEGAVGSEGLLQRGDRLSRQVATGQEVPRLQSSTLTPALPLPCLSCLPGLAEDSLAPGLAVWPSTSQGTHVVWLGTLRLMSLI